MGGQVVAYVPDTWQSRLDGMLADEAPKRPNQKPGDGTNKPDAPEKAATDKLAVEPGGLQKSRHHGGPLTAYKLRETRPAAGPIRGCKTDSQRR